MKSSLIYIICILIQFINGFGLLLGVFLDPVALLQPFFEEDLTTYVEADFLIFWTQGIVDVTAAHMIGAGLLLLVLRSFRLENRVNKQVFAAFGAFHGCALLVALYNHLFLGGGPPPFIGVLLIIQGGVLLYGWKKAID
ncbi:MAG TPA: hypothetical protein DCR42_02165 [Flavobacteriaceae bacterium]|jgi:hypothetical protein|uniref:hypothetical protein n=1 Tax=Algoriphagus sp. TaxID=1872435 RepID=UPI000E80ECC7|nr:hypothetical protein [Flavobacteriaceae bacterium]